LKLVAHQPEYIPYIGFFAKMSVADLFFFSDHLQFAVKDFQNRNYVLQGGNKVLLTVPVRTKDRADQPLREVEIDGRASSTWARKHLTTLEHAYSRSPFFPRYAPPLREIYQASWTHLCDLNITLIKQLAEWLEIRVPMRLSSELHLQEHKTRLLIEMCQRTGADTFVSGRGAAAYVEPELFAQNGLQHLFFNFAHPSYPQSDREFVPNLSILDLLFHCGPDAAIVVRKATAASSLTAEVSS
jgi:WbqC-like protein